ncbi:hypothetical protein [Streptomyces sp. KL116D]|uniref:hypothetical protein n=1 Tax=Streptomyces sp. KL116D TaxID=3045152 RepID=UPI003556E458
MRILVMVLFIAFGILWATVGPRLKARRERDGGDGWGETAGRTGVEGWTPRTFVLTGCAFAIFGIAYGCGLF